MPHKYLLAVVFAGLVTWHPSVADEPTAIPSATTEQIQQTVERAIWLSANRKRRLVEHPQMRRLPSRADAALG